MKSKRKIKTIGSLMMPLVATIDVTATVREAREVMRAKGIRHLPVLEDGTMIGVISQRDLELGVAVHLQALMNVRRVMRAPVFTATVDTPAEEVLSEMIARRIGSAVVVDGGGHPVGIFTTIDVMEEFRAELKK